MLSQLACVVCKYDQMFGSKLHPAPAILHPVSNLNVVISLPFLYSGKSDNITSSMACDLARAPQPRPIAFADLASSFISRAKLSVRGGHI